MRYKSARYIKETRGAKGYILAAGSPPLVLNQWLAWVRFSKRHLSTTDREREYIVYRKRERKEIATDSMYSGGIYIYRERDGRE